MYLVDTNQKWRSEAVSDKQRALLRRFRVSDEDIDQLSRGEASALLSLKMNQRRGLA